MATLNIVKIKEEILNLIRNSDIFTIAQRNVATETDNFTAGASQTTFVLANAGVKNIRTVIVDAATKVLGQDYDINIEGKTATESKTVTFVTPLTGGENVDINYDYTNAFKTNGTPRGDGINPDFPESFLTVKTFPRIGFDLISINNKNRSSNDSLQQKNILIGFGVFDFNKDIETREQTLYDLIFANRKTLFYLRLLRPSGRSGKDSYKQFGSTLVYSKLFNYTAPSQFEK